METIEIFKVLLNRIPKNYEKNILNNYSIDKIKEYIKNTDEFKEFRIKNLEKIKKIFLNILENDITGTIQSEIYLRTFIQLKYNEKEMYNFCLTKINNIKKDYKIIYKKSLDIDENIEINELIDILNSNIGLERYIFISEKFILKSEEKLKIITL